MLGGEDLMNKSRKPDIMADAAYVILSRDSRSYTGNFAIDEDVLKEVGVADLDQYAWVPGLHFSEDNLLFHAFWGRGLKSIFGQISPTTSLYERPFL